MGEKQPSTIPYGDSVVSQYMERNFEPGKIKEGKWGWRWLKRRKEVADGGTGKEGWL